MAEGERYNVKSVYYRSFAGKSARHEGEYCSVRSDGVFTVGISVGYLVQALHITAIYTGSMMQDKIAQ